MATIQDIDPRFKHIGKKVFVFITISLTILLIVIYQLGKIKDIFAKTVHLYFIHDTAFELSVNMPVKLAGFRIGRVSNITLDETAHVRVEMEIKKRYLKWIRQDSTATIKKEGYIGETIIEITFGSMDKPELKDGDQITFAKTKGLEDIAKEMVEELKPVALDVKNFVEYIVNPQGDVTKILKNTAHLTEELRTTNEELQKRIIEAKRSLKELEEALKNINKTSEELPKLTKSVDNSLQEIESLTKTINNKIPLILDETQRSLEEINKIAKDISRQSPRIGTMLDKAEIIADNVDDITESIKKSWFIKGNIPPKTPPSLIPPAFLLPQINEGKDK
ncbi:MAG: MlaD family protein [Proteobacteria bacterium]|nr:MlaD family protein [Pseudomonadota bacterium]